jgi:polysaccharide export outer membrane protein
MKHILPIAALLLAAATVAAAQERPPVQVPPSNSQYDPRVATSNNDLRVAPLDGTTGQSSAPSGDTSSGGASSGSTSSPLPGPANPAANQLSGPANSAGDQMTGGAPGEVSNYVLGPGDRLTLLVPTLEEFSDQTFSVDMQGDINLPLAGRFHAAGLTVNQFEQETRNRLRKFVKNPDVVASIAEYHSQTISVIGAVNAPGVHQLQGHKTLFEVLSMSGGLRTDAGSSINITRNLRWGAIPLPDAKNDPTNHFSIASVKVKSTVDASDPSENIVIMPDDVISVPKGQVVYAVGSVVRPGGFLLGEHDTMSSLQVLSLAEGFSSLAAPGNARILRSVPGSANRAEIPIDLKKLMAGKEPDVPLRPDDILFVPSSAAKTISKRTLDAAIQITTGLVVYGHF